MTPADLARVFGTRNAVPNFAPTWNLPPSQPAPSQPAPSQPAPSQPAPSQPAPVVRHYSQNGERHLDLLR